MPAVRRYYQSSVLLFLEAEGFFELRERARVGVELPPHFLFGFRRPLFARELISARACRVAAIVTRLLADLLAALTLGHYLLDYDYRYDQYYQSADYTAGDICP